MEFLAHQRAAYKAIRDGEFREYWAWGAIRTGKSVGHGAGFTRMLINEPGPYFVTNSSAGNVWAVQWPLIRAFAARAGVKARRVRGEAAYIEVGKSWAWVVGLKNAGSHDNYMGRTTRGGWYEEVNKCNRESFDMLLGRGSLKGAKHLMAMNPDGPRHWTAGYIADVAARQGWSQQTRLTDNTKLDPAYVEYLKSIYTLPHLKRRYIDGEFAAGEGLVHQYVPEVSTCVRSGRFAVCADAGASQCYRRCVRMGAAGSDVGHCRRILLRCADAAAARGRRTRGGPSCGATLERRMYAWPMAQTCATNLRNWACTAGRRSRM